jgi:FkbH-like protein
MCADIRPIDEADLDRVVQLIGKTNQFNLTTRRHGTNHVRQLLSMPGTIGCSLRLADRFGDHGLVSVLLACTDPSSAPGALRVDTWLMSCRVIGRTVEQFFFNYLLTEARSRGVRQLIGHYIPTPKNALVQDLYARLGFSVCEAATDGTVTYGLCLENARPAQTFVLNPCRAVS